MATAGTVREPEPAATLEIEAVLQDGTFGRSVPLSHLVGFAVRQAGKGPA